MLATKRVQRWIAWGVFGAAAIASIALIGYEGRGQTLKGDEWGYAYRLDTSSLWHSIFQPPAGKYLLVLPMLLYKVAFSTIGIADYLPYRIAGMALTVGVAALFLVLAKRRVGYALALPASILVLFLGSASEVTSTPLRIPEQMAVVAGLGMLVVLERRDLRGDIAACVLLLVSITSHPLGMAFAAAAAVLVLTRPSPERWRRSWVFAAPVILFAAWYLTLFTHVSGGPSLGQELGDVPRFEAQSLAAMAAAATGVFRSPFSGRVDFLTPLSYALAAVVAVAICVRAVRARVSAGFWAILIAILVLFAAPAFAPGPLRVPESARYIFPGVVFLMLLLAELGRGIRLKSDSARLAAATAVAAIFAFSMYSNIDLLKRDAAAWGARGRQQRAELAALDLARAVVAPNFFAENASGPLAIPSTHMNVSAHVYLAVASAYGSPAYEPDQLTSLSLPVSQIVDTVLARAMRLHLEPLQALRRGAPESPEVISTTGASRNSPPRCVTLQPGGGPASSQVSLPPGGASVAAGPGKPVQLNVARFGSSYVYPLAPLQAGDPSLLTIPRDSDPVPWRLLVRSADQPVTVCGVGEAAKGE